MWNIPAIAFAELSPGIANTGILLAHRTFKFKDDQWQTVDIENAVRNTTLIIFAGDFKLINNLNQVKWRVNIGGQKFRRLLQRDIFGIKYLAQCGR